MRKQKSCHIIHLYVIGNPRHSTLRILMPWVIFLKEKLIEDVMRANIS